MGMKTENGDLINDDSLSILHSTLINSTLLVIRAGFEPTTHSLEGCCSIQLSYRTLQNKRQRYDIIFSMQIGCISNCRLAGLLRAIALAMTWRDVETRAQTTVAGGHVCRRQSRADTFADDSRGRTRLQTYCHTVFMRLVV